MDKRTVFELKDELKKRGISLKGIKGTGSNQALVKADFVRLLSESLKKEEDKHGKKKEDHFSSLPKEMIGEIAMKIPIEDISNFCKTNKQIAQQCDQTQFWYYYLNKDQEKLHKLLVYLAGQGDWNLFKLIWSLTGDVGLIKERRTLKSAFNGAVRNNYDHLADKIWALNPQWLGKRLQYWAEKTQDNNTTKETTKEIAKLAIKLQESAKKKDKKRFRELIQELKKIPDPNNAVLIGELALAYSDFPFIIQGIKILNMMKIIEGSLVQIGIFALHKGRTDLINDFIKNEPKYGHYTPLISLISSKSPDTINILRHHWSSFIEVTPNDTGSERRIGNGEILIKYATKYPEDLFTILSSFRALGNEQFIALLKRVYKCLNPTIEGPEEMSAIDEFKDSLEFYGYDYLRYLFDKEIKIC